MKAVILAGGFGTRLSEETIIRPKPMIEIGGKPILWHIMKTYSLYGVKDFIICCGYKGYYIKEYFANYFLHQSDVTFNMYENKMEVHKKRAEDWKVTLIDTGLKTMTGGRLKRVKEFLNDQENFFFTYGDGVSDINIGKLLDFHNSHNKLATMTSTYPPGRFGAIKHKAGRVISFDEKPRGDGALINGGYFVLSPRCLDYIKGDETVWEKEPLINLASDNELMTYIFNGFWSPMDTLREKKQLENLINKNKAPWIKWEN